MTEIHSESRSLFEQAGISREAIDELMGQPLPQPGTRYFAAADGTPEAVSFASIGLRPFADLVYGGYDSSASVAGE